MSNETKRLLLVGDVHATPSEIDDCKKLINQVRDLCVNEKVDRVVFLGDLYHTHAVVRLEVMRFWMEAFNTLAAIGDLQVSAIVGNHDRPNDSSIDFSAIDAHAGMVDIHDAPAVFDGILYLPYYHDASEFVKVCSDHADVSTVICHQTFNGSKFENGFYAEGGVEPDSIPQTHVISGHIHTPQKFNKVEYIGSPRWRTVSDANQERFLVLVDVKDGKVVSHTKIKSGCRKILTYEDHAAAPLDADAVEKDNALVSVDVHGPAEYCRDRKQIWSALGARVRVFPKTDKVIRVKESEGIDVAFGKFVQAYSANRLNKSVVDSSVFSKTILERLNG